MATTAQIIGRNLKDFMKQRGLTAPALATLAGVSVGAIQKWVRGVQSPRQEEIGKLASALGCDVGDFHRVETPALSPKDRAAFAFNVLDKTIADDDLRKKGEDFMRALNREQLDRIAELKKKGRKKP